MPPWEKYQQQSAPSNAPWKKYSATDEKEEKKPSGGFIDEMHPDITTGQRLIAKNLANSPKAQAAYLAKEMPDHDIKVQNDRVLVKKAGEQDYRVLDPGGLELADVGDVLWDIGAGIGEAGATVAGALGGLAATPAGSIAAGAAAGGLAGAGLETGRQMLGEAAGIPQDLSGTNIGISAAGGALGPLLFGAGGKVASGLAKKGATQGVQDFAAKGLMKKPLEAMGEIAAKPYSYAADKFMDTAEALSGIDKETYRHWFRRLGEMKDLEGTKGKLMETIDPETGEKVLRKSKVDGTLDSANKSLMTAWRKLEANRRNLGEQLGAVRNQGEVDVSGVNQMLEDRITFLSTKDPATLLGSQKDELAALQDMKSKLSVMNKKTVEVIENVPTGHRHPISGKPMTQAQTVTKEVDVGELPTTLAGDDIRYYMDTLKDYSGLLKGKGVAEQAVTAGEKNMAKLASDMGVAAKQVEDASLGGAADLKAKLGVVKGDLDLFKKHFIAGSKNPDFKGDAAFGSKGLNSLRNLLKENKKDALDFTERMDTTYGTGLLQKADDLSAYKWLRNPSTVPISSGGTTSTSRTLTGGGAGSALGYFLGVKGLPGVMGGGRIGAQIGMALGTTVGGPRGMKKNIARGLAAERQLKKAIKQGRNNPYIRQAVWDMMQGE